MLIAMDDGGVRTLCDVQHIPELRKNLISLHTLQANGFINRTNGDQNNLRVYKGALIVMKAEYTLRNIYELLGSIVVHQVAFVESDNDATKL